MTLVDRLLELYAMFVESYRYSNFTEKDSKVIDSIKKQLEENEKIVERVRKIIYKYSNSDEPLDDSYTTIRIVELLEEILGEKK